VTSTCDRWGFWLFRNHHGNFLFRDNLFGSLRHLKDISVFTLREYKDKETQETFSRTKMLFFSP
jgi:hypothetical protein